MGNTSYPEAETFTMTVRISQVRMFSLIEM